MEDTVATCFYGFVLLVWRAECTCWTQQYLRNTSCHKNEISTILKKKKIAFWVSSHSIASSQVLRTELFVIKLLLSWMYPKYDNHLCRFWHTKIKCKTYILSFILIAFTYSANRIWVRCNKAKRTAFHVGNSFEETFNSSHWKKKKVSSQQWMWL